MGTKPEAASASSRTAPLCREPRYLTGHVPSAGGARRSVERLPQFGDIPAYNGMSGRSARRKPATEDGREEMQVKTAMIVMAIMGCDDSATKCTQLSLSEPKWETVAACDKDSEQELARYSNVHTRWSSPSAVAGGDKKPRRCRTIRHISKRSPHCPRPLKPPRRNPRSPIFSKNLWRDQGSHPTTEGVKRLSPNRFTLLPMATAGSCERSSRTDIRLERGLNLERGPNEAPALYCDIWTRRRLIGRTGRALLG